MTRHETLLHEALLFERPADEAVGPSEGRAVERSERRQDGPAPAPALAPAPRRAASDDLIELLFFAYRDFVGDPDRILAQYGFGRAHHRVLHFVDRYPGLTVAELLDILRITKQSLNRVLKDLIEQGHVRQRPGTSDRRQRLLFCTSAGTRLADELGRVQARRVVRALADAVPASEPASEPASLPDPGAGGADAYASARAFLVAMIEPAERDAVARLMARRARVPA